MNELVTLFLTQEPDGVGKPEWKLLNEVFGESVLARALFTQESLSANNPIPCAIEVLKETADIIMPTLSKIFPEEFTLVIESIPLELFTTQIISQILELTGPTDTSATNLPLVVSMGIPDGAYMNITGGINARLAELGFSQIYEVIELAGGKIKVHQNTGLQQYWMDLPYLIEFENTQFLMVTAVVYQLLLGSERFINNPTLDIAGECYDMGRKRKKKL